MGTLKNEWFGNVRNDILSGMVVAIALIPEAIGFSIVAGVNPMVGLYASFCIAIITAFAGGRLGLISAATGSMALVLANLVSDYGLEYMLAATILTGIIQIVLGAFRIGQLLRFIPSPVMTGFVNALGIMIFMTQLDYFEGAGISMYILVLAGLLIIYLFPKLNKTIPAPLIAIIVLTAFTLFSGISVVHIGDIGDISGELPSFAFPDIPLNLDTLKIIFPYSLSLAIVGLSESMLTSQLIDEMTGTSSAKNRECVGQGIANVINGFFGGMAGCGMIGQSVINIKSGGRGRLSTFVAGVFLMILILILNNWVVQIPIAALVAVMIVVSVSTFDWSSIPRILKVPKSDTFVMLMTVAVVMATNNLAIGIVLGTILGSLFFANKISQVRVDKKQTDKGIEYKCYGQLFFASTTHFLEHFDFTLKDTTIYIDMTHLKFWDLSAVEAFDKLLARYSERHVGVKIDGLSDACVQLLETSSRQYSLMPEYVD